MTVNGTIELTAEDDGLYYEYHYYRSDKDLKQLSYVDCGEDCELAKSMHHEWTWIGPANRWYAEDKNGDHHVIMVITCNRNWSSCAK